MWISKKKYQALEKRIADLEVQVQGQQVKNEISFEFCRSVANKEGMSLLSYQQLYGPSIDSNKKVRMLLNEIRKISRKERSRCESPTWVNAANVGLGKITGVDKEVRKMPLTEEEVKKFKEFEKKDGNKYLEENESITLTPITRDFAMMIEAFNALTSYLNFSEPFRLVIDYDPEQPRCIIKQHFTQEALQRIREGEGQTRYLENRLKTRGISR